MSLAPLFEDLRSMVETGSLDIMNIVLFHFPKPHVRGKKGWFPNARVFDLLSLLLQNEKKINSFLLLAMLYRAFLATFVVLFIIFIIKGVILRTFVTFRLTCTYY